MKLNMSKVKQIKNDEEMNDEKPEEMTEELDKENLASMMEEVADELVLSEVDENDDEQTMMTNVKESEYRNEKKTITLGEQLRKITESHVEKLRNKIMEESLKQAEACELKATIKLEEKQIELFKNKLMNELLSEDVNVTIEEDHVNITW